MRSFLSSIFAAAMTVSAALMLNGCASGLDGYSGYGGYGGYNTGRNIITPGVYVGKDYSDYTRYDSYPGNSGGTYYSYGGRYYGGGYGSNN